MKSKWALRLIILGLCSISGAEAGWSARATEELSGITGCFPTACIGKACKVVKGKLQDAWDTCVQATSANKKLRKNIAQQEAQLIQLQTPAIAEPTKTPPYADQKFNAAINLAIQAATLSQKQKMLTKLDDFRNPFNALSSSEQAHVSGASERRPSYMHMSLDFPGITVPHKIIKQNSQYSYPKTERLLFLRWRSFFKSPKIKKLATMSHTGWGKIHAIILGNHTQETDVLSSASLLIEPPQLNQPVTGLPLKKVSQITTSKPSVMVIEKGFSEIPLNDPTPDLPRFSSAP